MSMESILERLRSYETIGERALPGAAIRIADKLRATIRLSRKKQIRDRTNHLIGQGVADKQELRRKMKKLRARHKSGGGSGIPILGIGTATDVTITGSRQVQYLSVARDERPDWITILREAVRAAGAEVE